MAQVFWLLLGIVLVTVMSGAATSMGMSTNMTMRRSTRTAASRLIPIRAVLVRAVLEASRPLQRAALAISFCP